MTRQFTDSEAKRARVPLLVGLAGASGSGKTYSALRLATGMQAVSGGEIFVIDTESRRALHYADSFNFRHVDFQAPFSPDDYRAALEHCKAQGASIVVVDSASHEHEGTGGVLEWHERELDRMAGQDFAKRNRMTFGAWAKPKAARRRLINTILQLGIDAIFCFRAKEKLKIERGKDPQPLGWMPIGGDEWVFEMTVNTLLYPGSGGVPTWNPGEVGEKMMVKLPEQFREHFIAKPRALDEETGEFLAAWALGDGADPRQPKPASPGAPSHWLGEVLGMGKKEMGGKPAAQQTWAWFAEGAFRGGRYSYLVDVLEKVKEMEQTEKVQIFAERAAEVVSMIEADEGGA